MKKLLRKIDLKNIKWKNYHFKAYKNCSILTKLLSGFLFVTVLAGIVGVFGMVSIERMNKSNKELFDKLNAPMQYMSFLNEHYYKMRIAATKGVLSDNVDYVVYQMSAVVNEKSQINTVLESLEGTWGERDTETVNKFKESLNTAYAIIDDILAMIDNDDSEKAMEALNSIEAERVFTSVERGLTSLISLKISNANEQLQLNEEGFKQNKNLMILILVITLFLSIIIGAYNSYVLSSPIKNLTKAANRLAKGEVDIEVEVGAKDEIGQLTKAFSMVIDNIKTQAMAAERIANGNLDINIEPKSEKDILANSMVLVISTLNSLLKEIDYLITELNNENFGASGNTESFSGAYNRIISGVNSAVKAVSEKTFWYEAMLDSIPFPVTVTDLSMNITFANRQAERLMNSSRKDLLGKKCGSCWNTTICNTENCAMVKLRNNETRVNYELESKNCQVDSSFLSNSAGEKIGHIEVVQDITARTRALEFQKSEVAKLTENLKLLAEGSLDLNLSVAEGDEYTIEEHRNFTEINNNVEIAVTSISNYIRDISYILNEMAAGNLDVSVMSDYKGDFVEIKDSLNSIINSLNKVVVEINSLSDQVAAGSRQVSDGSLGLSQGSTEQASSVEELTASIGHVAAQTKQNAINANSANELAIKAREDATEGDEQMKGMLTSMEEISEAYNKIAKIIKIIDEIAFQTNILALNASVEAARAGQHGKGFAVVAEEVRSLAIRSANAAKDTEDLIESSIEIVNKGTKKAVTTSEALKTIVSGIGEASKIVEEIAKASDEQANAISQINLGIEQVSKVVQSNSSTAEEGAAASEELTCHADKLRELVGRFSTGKGIVSENAEPAPNTTPNRKSISSRSEKMVKIELSDDEFDKY